MDPEPSFFLHSTLDTDLVFGFIALFALLFCSALVSGAEVALFSLSQKDIEDTLQEDPSKGKIISKLLEKPKKLLATLLVANNFINIGVIILFSYLGHQLFSAISSTALKFSIEVIIATFLMVSLSFVIFLITPFLSIVCEQEIVIIASKK